MCGIAGAWEPDHTRWRVRDIEAGLQRISHRGPDDRGVEEWIAPGRGRTLLGSTRLAILDLSPAGHMPMGSADGRFTLVFNGEITNYVEIRNELLAAGRTFASTSDTEVLLQAWAQWGAACLPKFEGMFAFAVVDRQRGTLTLVRDVFGVKPLFFAHADDGRFVFSSELPSLLGLLPGRPRLDWQNAVDYLQSGVYDTTDRTFVEGVRQLAPGHSVVLDLATGLLSAPQRYWLPSVDRNDDLSFVEAAELVREGFLASVQRNLRSDVPVGVALSGGIDSSAIACAVRHLEPDFDLQTFSFIAPGFSDSEDRWIELVAGATGATSHTVVATGAELLRDLDSMITAQGEPFGSTSIYAQYRVFQLARENGVVVTLDGQGADEMFAGYDGYPAQRLQSLIERGRLREARAFLGQWSTWPGRSSRAATLEAIAQFMPPAVARGLESARARPNGIIDYDALNARGVSARYPRLTVDGARGRRLPSYLRSRLTRRGLPALLRHGDRNSMHFSIESRVPFLDTKLAELALGLPEEYLVSPGGETKRVLRHAMRGIVPDAILDRRDKIGFATPESSWLDEFRREAVEPTRLAGSPVGFINEDIANAAARSATPERDLGLGGGGLWRYLNLRRWIEIFDIDAS